MSAEESDLVENPPSPQDSPKAETLKEETPEIEDPSHAAALDSPAKMNQAGTSVSDKDSVTSSTTDVPFMDWAEFESNYTKALIDANEVEDRLVEDFQKLSKASQAEVFLNHLLMSCQAFMLWADASANHDNMRVAKR